MKYLHFIAIFYVALATLAGCDRPGFGTQAKTGDVIDTDVVREAPTESNQESDGVDVQPGDEGDANQNNVSEPIPSSSPDRFSSPFESIVDANAEFGFDAYRVSARTPGPVVIGSYGLTRSAAVASLGAAGTARAELEERIATGLVGDELHDAFNTLDYDLTTRDSLSEIDLVTATWVRQSAQVEQGFVDDLSRYYGLTVRRAQFETRPDDARIAINNFYRDRTGGELTDVVPVRAVDTTTELLVTDGNRFRGTFQDAFDPEYTKEADFNGRDGVRRVPTMIREGSVLGTTLDDLRAVELDFDGGFSILLILPDEGRFDEVEERFGPELVDQILSNLQPSYLVLGVPRVTISGRVDLLQRAGELGLDGVFNSDFSSVSPNARLSNVVQQTRLQIVEDGIGADPVDLPPLDESEAMGADVPSFFLSRSFLYVVRDNETGTILFLGRYE